MGHVPHVGRSCSRVISHLHRILVKGRETRGPALVPPTRLTQKLEPDHEAGSRKNMARKYLFFNLKMVYAHAVFTVLKLA